MDVIIVVHTEFGFVHAKEVIPDKNATEGVSKGVPNLIKVADNHGARITFAVMPEVVDAFPKDISHEVGLHVHAGWEEFSRAAPSMLATVPPGALPSVLTYSVEGLPA